MRKVDSGKRGFGGVKIDAGFRDCAEIDQQLEALVRAGRAVFHGVSFWRASSRFSMALRGLKPVTSMVRLQDRIAELRVLGCGALAVSTKAESKPRLRAMCSAAWW